MKKIIYFLTLCRAIVNLSKYSDTYIGEACKQISAIREELNGGLQKKLEQKNEHISTLKDYLTSCKADIITLNQELEDKKQVIAELVLDAQK